MKNYKEYETINLGSSDIASLTIRSCDNVDILNFGEDGTYHAYLVDENAEIGNHYLLEKQYHTWINIFDDDSLVFTAKSNIIKIFRSGEFGCIIQLN